MYEPHIDLTGYLAFDPTVKFTPNGHQVVDLRVATSRRYQVGEEWHDGETLWFDVACWKQLAENVSQSVKKGDKVVVSGKLLQRSWTREDGSVGTTLVIDATHVGIDLGRHPVVVRRPIRDGSAADALRERWDTGPAGQPAEVGSEVAPDLRPKEDGIAA